MSFTYLCFYRACLTQNLDRRTLPYTAPFMPYAAYYALVGTFIMIWVGGYPVFLAGKWSVPTFLFSYTMCAVFPILFVGWKLLKKTRWLTAEEVDLRKDVEEIEEYTREYVPQPPR